MKRNRKVTELRNIGRTIAGRLHEVGISSEDDLRRLGAAGAHRLIRQRYPRTTLPLCYYLYSFEGALRDKHWNDIGEKRKRELAGEID